MNTANLLETKGLFTNKYQKYLYLISSIGLTAGFILSLISWMEICSQECAAAHSYRLFGLKFEDIGMAFFPLVIALHLGSLIKSVLSFFAGLFLA
jgi:hypothetical protein